MALTRVTDKKLAANRANAQKSTGPRTPEGKARSSRNACRHYVYARTHRMPESWDREFREKALFLTRDTTNPARRAIALDFHFHNLWAERLANQERNIIATCLNRFPDDPKRAIPLFAFDPGTRAFQRHVHRVERKLRGITHELEFHRKPPSPASAAASPRIPHPPPPTSSSSSVS
ncbi:MAG: hypothetical protein IPP47_29725 [Bryobacterales bacterium]|nr:hypothetical protein [Bryobacterales bacterium]